ncbi:hypothetical protein ACJ41O_010439 [Fusarium nematophilum]
MTPDTAAGCPYKYSALADPKSNIRLLCVKHADRDRVECSFTHVPSPSSQKYNCLSYTWGDPFGRDTTNVTYQIQCDGGYLHVGQNLYDALLHLWRVQKDKLAAIWIDALCINQQDEVEKGDQIKMMDRIYSEAESVVIWLGPEDPAKRGNEMIREVVRRILEEEESGHLRTALDGVTDPDSATINTDGAALFDSLLRLNDGERAEAAMDNMPLIGEIDAKHWHAVFNMVDRAYWSRLWIWQELVAAKADPVVVCGDAVFSWEAIRKVSHYFTIFGSDALIRLGKPISKGRQMIPRNRPHQVAHCRDEYMDPQSGPAWMRRRFGRLVFDTNRNSYQCFDERDKIYAHMGLCQFDKLDDWDYGAPFWDLYRQFWFEIVDRTKNLNFLTFVEDASARQARPKAMRHDVQEGLKKGSLPTWVPDLRARLEPISMWSEFQFIDDFDISKNLDDKVSYEIHVDRGTGRLTLHGCMLDTIVQFGESYEELERQESIPGILELVKDLLAVASPTPYERPNGAMDAVLSSIILLAELDATEEEDRRFPVPQAMRVRCKDWLLHSLAHAEIIATQNYCTVRQKALLRELEDVDTVGVVPSPARVMEYAEACKEHMREVTRLANANDEQNQVAQHGEVETEAGQTGGIVADVPSAGEASLPRYEPLANSNDRIHDTQVSQTEEASAAQPGGGSDLQDQDADADDATGAPNTGPQLPASRIGLHQRGGESHVGMAAVSAGDYGLARMRLFRTAQGWVGKGPQSLHTTDEIWIMPGAEVAFVLRKSRTGRHLYVGHAYVHGLMSGEAREEFRGRELEEVVLE